MLYSYLPQFWFIFEKIVLISPLDSQGYLTCTMADTYLRHVNIDFMTPTEFWDAVAYCLVRKNQKIMTERKRQRKKMYGKTNLSTY